MRTILLQSGGGAILPTVAGYVPSQEPLDARVANIGAEIVAALAQAQTRIYEEEDDTESGSGPETARPELMGPIASGDEVETGEHNGVARSMKELSMLLHEDDGEDDDSDAFPIPLRTRKAKEPVGVVGNKRKR